MNRKLKAPPKPSMGESLKLRQYLIMQDWHFDCTIKLKCTEVASYTVYWEKVNNEHNCIEVKVFGLRAVKSETNESCIANFFIRYKSKIYQSHDLMEVLLLVKAIKKEGLYEQYKSKLYWQRWREKQKLRAVKNKDKTIVKDLKLVSKKKTA